MTFDELIQEWTDSRVSIGDVMEYTAKKDSYWARMLEVLLPKAGGRLLLELLALADELEGMDCRTCPADGTKDCRDLPCEEAVARAAARRIREVVEHDACEDTTVSAYDLLSDDDRKAIAWVREHGGLDDVEKRLMPPGMEWPTVSEFIEAVRMLRALEGAGVSLDDEGNVVVKRMAERGE